MLNKTILMGRLATNPENLTIGENNIKSSFVIAVKRNYTPKGGQDVDFINVNAWNKTADFIKKYFKKGNLITLEGELHVDRFEDKNGKKSSRHGVVVEKVYFCEKKKESENGKNDYEDSDLPF